MLRIPIFIAVALAVAVAQTSARAMTFQAVRIGGAETSMISAVGEITQSTPTDFLSFLEANSIPRHPTLFLDSPGGRVLASMELGALFRKAGAEVMVARIEPEADGGAAVISADCFSACVYALMGASRRIIPRQSQVGIHRMFAYQDELDASGTAVIRHRRYDNGEMRDFLMRYSTDMGISPGLIAAAEHVPSTSIKILSPSEIRRWHLGVSRR